MWEEELPEAGIFLALFDRDYFAVCLFVLLQELDVLEGLVQRRGYVSFGDA